MKNKGEHSQFLEPVLLLIVALAVMLSLLTCDRPDIISQPGAIREVSSGWYFIKENQRIPVTLPGIYTSKENEPLILYNDRLSDDDGGMTLTFQSAVYRPKIMLGETELYSYEDSAFPRNQQMRAKLNCNATLTKHLENETLMIIFENDGGCVYELPSVYIGNSNDVFRHQCSSEIFTIFIVLAMALISIAAIGVFIYLSAIRMPDYRFLHIAAFLFLCGAWCILDSSMVQQLTQMSPVVCYLAFYALMTLPIPMLHFIRSTGDMTRYFSLKICTILFYANVVAQSILDFFGVFHFTDMLVSTHLLLAFGCSLLTVLLIKESRRTRNAEIHSFLKAFAALAACGVFSMGLYWLLKVPYYGFFFEVGILVFIIILLCSLITAMASTIRFKAEALIYRRLSREDRLTGLLNRRSFDDFMASLEENASSYNDVALIFMDLNRLKYINDHYGHNAGDEMIIGAARCIEGAFSEKGTCYRIGGDEFAVILTDPEEDEEKWNEYLDAAILSYNNNNRHHLSIARGVSFLRDDKNQIKRMSDWKHEADQAMYLHKKRQRLRAALTGPKNEPEDIHPDRDIFKIPPADTSGSQYGKECE